MLGIEGLGIAQELPNDQGVVRGWHHKVGQLADIAYRMVDVPAHTAFTPRVQLGLAGGIQLGFIVSHMGKDDGSQGDFTGYLGQKGLANGGEEMEDAQLGLERLAGSGY